MNKEGLKLKIIGLLLAGALLVSFNSCKNDIDVLADWKEVAVVYGLLDASLPQQYIRINKAYRNANGDASQLGKIADSLYFDTIYDAHLLEIETGRKIPLTKISSLPKDSGAFAYNPNYTYATPYDANVNGVNRIKISHHYRLVFAMPATKQEVSSETLIVEAARVISPVVNTKIDVNPSKNLTLSIKSGINAKIYDARLVFHYTDILKSDTNVKTDHSVTWKLLSSFRTVSASGNESIVYAVSGKLFYEFIASAIPVDNAVNRRAGTVTIEYVGGAPEVDNYISASEPSIGIVQKQSDYSNVNNGMGLFSSRNFYITPPVRLTDITLALLRSEPITQPLGFVQ